MFSANDLVPTDRRLKSTLESLEVDLMTQIQVCLDGGESVNSKEMLLFTKSVLAVREFMSLRIRVAKLMPYVEHTADCTVNPAVMGDDGIIHQPARPCTCGLDELLK